MQDLGRLLIVFGFVIVIVGAALLLGSRIPFLGRLPGDLTITGSGFTCFIPLATSIILSIVLTILVQLALRIFNR